MNRRQRNPPNCDHLEPTAPLPPAEASRYQPIPVAAAAELAQRHHKQLLVVIAFDRESQRTDLVTWGESALDKEDAFRQGTLCLKALAADLERVDIQQDYHADFRPALQQEALDLLRRVEKSKGCSSTIRQSIGRLFRLAEALAEK